MFITNNVLSKKLDAKKSLVWRFNLLYNFIYFEGELADDDSLENSTVNKSSAWVLLGLST